MASTALCLILILPAAAPAKTGHGPIGDRAVTIAAVTRGAGPGDPWSALITIQADNGAPLTGLDPVLSLTDRAGGRYFAAGQRTDTPGTYRARLPAPAEGAYRVMVDDGLGVQHAAGTTRVLDSAAGSRAGTGGNAGWAVPLGVAAALGCLILLTAVRRARGDAPSAGVA